MITVKAKKQKGKEHTHARFWESKTHKTQKNTEKTKIIKKIFENILTNPRKSSIIEQQYELKILFEVKS
ncbi:MAG: hypothetical protein E7666_08515 [Ruminococcaceae bacterium]|nr:hypothetical protein [Oscillospiraceae bacterium]